MKKNKTKFGLIVIAIFLTLVVSFNPLKKLIKNVSNDLSDSKSNKSITASFTYKDAEGNEVHTGEKLYVFISENDEGNGARITLELEANAKDKNVSKLYDQEGKSQDTSIDNKEYKVIVAKPKTSNVEKITESTKYDQNKFDKINSESVYNGSYTISYPSTINLNSENTLQIQIKAIKGNKISLDEMLSPMETATRFGVFALDFELGADVEATIGVKNVSKAVEQTFGLSTRNYKALDVSKLISVSKTYTKNGKPLSNKTVNIELQQSEKTLQEKKCITNVEGKCNVEFDKLSNGNYTVAEKINGKDISSNGSVTDEDNTIVNVEFDNNNIELKDLDSSSKIDYNFNYIGGISENSSEKIHLEKMRRPGTIVFGTESLYTEYKDNQEYKDKTGEEKVIVGLAGTNGFEVINFDNEFDKLKELSVKLASVVDSDDVKVYHMNAEDISKFEINFNSEKKEYILVNVDCTNKTEVIIGGRNKRDGESLYNEENIQNNESNFSFVYDNGAKIIYNFYTKENGVVEPYSKNIKTAASTTGIILAPDADVEGATGNHAGTIIAKNYNHINGEVHQKVKPITNSSKANASIINKIVEEEKKEQIFEVSKVDENGNPIIGAEVQLTDEKGNVIDKWTTTSEKHKVQSELKIGEKYTIHEIKAPEGYQLARDYTFTYNGQETQEYTMIDTKVIVKKTDEEKKYLPGATLQILDLKGNIIETWTSGDTEHIVTSKLNPGEKYVLHEENAPLGYKKAKDVQFVFEAGEKNKIIELENQKIVIGVFVEKLDWNKKELSGAQLQILDSENNIIDSWTSDGSVHRVQAKLEIGKKYRLHEKSAPEGYEISKDVEFVVKNTEDNQMVRMMDNKIIIKGEPFVKISKVDKNEKYLVGAELQLLDSNGNVIEQWMSNDQTHIVDAKLEIGKQYTLHEVSAPSGYEKAEDIIFTAKADEQEIKMTDERIRKVAGVVETLDDISKYIIIFAVSLILLFGGFIGFIIYNKKKLSK